MDFCYFCICFMIALETDLGPILAPIWIPKTSQNQSNTGPERRPRKNFEKVAEKCANLGPCTCLNLVRGLRNTGFRVFRKRLQMNLQRPPFWRPFGLLFLSWGLQEPKMGGFWGVCFQLHFLNDFWYYFGWV